MADKSIVKSFLQELKQLIKVWGIIFSNRPKNSIQNLADLSITAKMREEIILNLEVKDYSEGPLDETQQGGTEMWIFGKTNQRSRGKPTRYELENTFKNSRHGSGN